MQKFPKFQHDHFIGNIKDYFFSLSYCCQSEPKSRTQKQSLSTMSIIMYCQLIRQKYVKNLSNEKNVKTCVSKEVIVHFGILICVLS